MADRTQQQPNPAPQLLSISQTWLLIVGVVAFLIALLTKQPTAVVLAPAAFGLVTLFWLSQKWDLTTLWVIAVVAFLVVWFAVGFAAAFAGGVVLLAAWLLPRLFS